MLAKVLDSNVTYQYAAESKSADAVQPCGYAPLYVAVSLRVAQNIFEDGETGDYRAGLPIDNSLHFLGSVNTKRMVKATSLERRKRNLLSPPRRLIHDFVMAGAQWRHWDHRTSQAPCDPLLVMVLHETTGIFVAIFR